MPRNRGSDWYRRPGMILAEIIQKAAIGDERPAHYHRATVLAVDHKGGQLQNPEASGGMTVRDRDGRTRTFPAMTGPANPKGSVKARILTDGLDRLIADEDLRVFWPMLPQDQIGIPVSPGEHVYVVFEGEGLEHGLWISRVSGHESANSYKGSDSYSEPSAQRSAMDYFEPNEPEYQKTDEHAGLAPPDDATRFFKGD